MTRMMTPLCGGLRADFLDHNYKSAGFNGSYIYVCGGFKNADEEQRSTAQVSSAGSTRARTIPASTTSSTSNIASTRAAVTFTSAERRG